MRARAVITALIILLALAFSCERERPTVPDGENNLRLYAVDTSGNFGGWTALEGATIRVSSSTHVFAAEYETGHGGFTILDELAAGTYMIQAELINETELYTILGQKEISVLYDPQMTDTVFMNYQQSSPLTMNEVYYCGCNSSRFYYYDQFIELYNSSPDTIWLDGYLVCRNTNIRPYLPRGEGSDARVPDRPRAVPRPRLRRPRSYYIRRELVCRPFRRRLGVL